MTFLKALQSLPLSQKIITFLHPSYLDFVVANIYIYKYVGYSSWLPLELPLDSPNNQMGFNQHLTKLDNSVFF